MSTMSSNLTTTARLGLWIALLTTMACADIAEGVNHAGGASSHSDAGEPTGDAAAQRSESAAVGDAADGGRRTDAAVMSGSSSPGDTKRASALGGAAAGGSAGTAPSDSTAPATGEPGSDADAGPVAAAPQADAGPLCAACGGCEEVQTVVSTMHTTQSVTYKDPPPTSGPHNPCWARWGIHDEPLAAERWVHNLEHGAVVYLYNCPDGCDAEVAMIEQLTAARAYAISTAYPDLPARFAAVAWGRRLVTDCLDLTAFTQFYDNNANHAPESNLSDPSPGCPP